MPAGWARASAPRSYPRHSCPLPTQSLVAAVRERVRNAPLGIGEVRLLLRGSRRAERAAQGSSAAAALLLLRTEPRGASGAGNAPTALTGNRGSHGQPEEGPNQIVR